jgi:uncharacterized RDD family membrane protein YckC
MSEEIKQEPPLSQSSVQELVQVKYAGFWVRWVAFIVDGMIISIPINIIAFLLSISIPTFNTPDGQTLVMSVINFAVILLYSSLMIYYKGATLGKMLVGIEVKSEDLRPLSITRIILREVSKIISTLIIFIGYIMAGFTEKKQALHDKIVCGVVVYKDPLKSNRAGLIVGIIIAAFLPAIAIVGIFSSVVLASLNSARTKGQDAAIKGEMAILRTQSLLYEDSAGSFKGFCIEPNTVEKLKKISMAGASNEYSYVCNDTEKNWAISNPLKSKGYWCVDSTENQPQIVSTQLINQVSCSTSNSTTTENKNLTAMRDLLKDEFVNGCASGSTPKTYCVCVFDKMEEGLGFDGLLDVFKKYDETGTMDAKTINLIKPCSN